MGLRLFLGSRSGQLQLRRQMARRTESLFLLLSRTVLCVRQLNVCVKIAYTI